MVDTLHLAFETIACSKVLDLEYQSRSKPDYKIETERWTLRAGRLRGQNCYHYRAEGHGPMDGIQVIWGPAEVGSDSSSRRFKVMFGSKVLWTHRTKGGNASQTANFYLEMILGDLWASEPVSVKVRRVDVCIDHWGFTWNKSDLDRFACRQKSRGLIEHNEPIPEEKAGDTSEYQGPTSATYYVGSLKNRGAVRVLRIYNKSIEARDSGKLPWLEPIWKANGWDGRRTVWRAEIEFGGQWLQDHGFDTIEKLQGCEHALWLDYCEDVRHTIGENTRMENRASSPVWETLRKIALAAKRWIDEKATWIWQPRPPSVDGDMEQLKAMGAGCFRKIKKAMFNDHGTDDAFFDFLRKALEQSEAKARKREGVEALPVSQVVAGSANSQHEHHRRGRAGSLGTDPGNRHTEPSTGSDRTAARGESGGNTG